MHHFEILAAGRPAAKVQAVEGRLQVLPAPREGGQVKEAHQLFDFSLDVAIDRGQRLFRVVHDCLPSEDQKNLTSISPDAWLPRLRLGRAAAGPGGLLAGFRRLGHGNQFVQAATVMPELALAAQCGGALGPRLGDGLRAPVRAPRP